VLGITLLVFSFYRFFRRGGLKNLGIGLFGIGLCLLVGGMGDIRENRFLMREGEMGYEDVDQSFLIKDVSKVGHGYRGKLWLNSGQGKRISCEIAPRVPCVTENRIFLLSRAWISDPDRISLSVVDLEQGHE